MRVWNTNLPVSKPILVGYVCESSVDLIHYGYEKSNAYWIVEKGKIVNWKGKWKKIKLKTKKLTFLTYATNELLGFTKKVRSDKTTLLSINSGI